MEGFCLRHILIVACALAVGCATPIKNDGYAPHLKTSNIEGLVKAKFPPRYSNANCHAAAAVGSGILTVLLSLPQENCFQPVDSPHAGDIGFIVDKNGDLARSYHSFVYMNSSQIFQKADPGWNVHPFEIVTIERASTMRDYFRNISKYENLDLKWGRYVPSDRCYITRFQNWLSKSRGHSVFGPVIRHLEDRARGVEVDPDQSHFQTIVSQIDKIVQGQEIPVDLRDGVRSLLHEYLIAPGFESARKDLIAEKSTVANELGGAFKKAVLSDKRIAPQIKKVIGASYPRYTWLAVAAPDGIQTAYLELPYQTDVGRITSAIGKVGSLKSGDFVFQASGQADGSYSVSNSRAGAHWQLKLAPYWFFTQFTSDQFEILNQKVTWSYDEERLQLEGVHSERSVVLRYPDGKQKMVPVPLDISNLRGEQWSLLSLFKQIQVNTESDFKVIKENPGQDLGKVEIDPHNLSSWQILERVPIPVRAKLRSPLRLLIQDHYPELVVAMQKRLRSDGRLNSIPFVLKCLTLPRESLNKDQVNPTEVVLGLRVDVVDSCLGLISPSTNVLADSLAGRPAPQPIAKRFFAFDDPGRPKWKQPALILTHASQEFHFPVTMKPAMQKWIDFFHQAGNPIAFIFHNDRFNDASYFVRPGPNDLAFYSEDGKNPLCENCPEVTFGGGYIDYCFGLAVRSYIANFFRDKTAGDIRINFALDSIYTEAVTKKGEEGAKTALSEMQEIGPSEFIKKRIGQYMERAVLSDFAAKDKAGRFYPYLRLNDFAFRVQVDGRDFIDPVGDRSLNRRITFNLVTKGPGR